MLIYLKFKTELLQKYKTNWIKNEDLKNIEWNQSHKK